MLRTGSILPLSLIFAAFAACSGGGSTDAAGSARTGSTPGAVHIAVDSAADSAAWIQFQVAGAALRRSDGTPTANLLPADVEVMFADPAGEVNGLTLRNVPTGEYTELHLAVVPDSGVAQRRDGSTIPVNTVIDLTVPLPVPLVHDGQRVSWLTIGHDAPAPDLTGLASARWEPMMSGRVGGVRVFSSLRVMAVQADEVVGTVTSVDEGSVQIAFEHDCMFADASGAPIPAVDPFLDPLQNGDDLCVRGHLDRNGMLRATHARHCNRGRPEPRMIGRITSIDTALTEFTMDVLAEVRTRGRRLLPRPESAVVQCTNATIRHSHTHRMLTFADLEIGNLAKVEWSQRSVTNGVATLVATEIEVTGRNLEPSFEWQGMVSSVDTGTNTIVVVPRPGETIVIGGVPVSSVDVNVLSTAVIERRELHGPGRSRITLAEVVVGDRIWISGVETGPTAVDADWIRVRAPN